MRPCAQEVLCPHKRLRHLAATLLCLSALTRRLYLAALRLRTSRRLPLLLKQRLSVATFRLMVALWLVPWPHGT